MYELHILLGVGCYTVLVGQLLAIFLGWAVCGATTILLYSLAILQIPSLGQVVVADHGQ